MMGLRTAHHGTWVLCLLLVPSAAPADWPTARGNAQRTGCVDGRPLWQLRMPGELIHMEGAPTVANKRVYIGGGNAGVLCLERDRASLDGKELDDAAIQQILDMKWKELQVKFEAEKKKDPDL